MLVLNKIQQAHYRNLQADIAAQKRRVKDAEWCLRSMIESRTPPGTKDLDLYVCELRRKLKKLEVKLAVFEARHTVSESLVKAAGGKQKELQKHALSQPHLWKPDRKDSHGY